MAGKRDQFIIATKFGFEINDDGNWVMGSINGRPDYVRKSVERSLKTSAPTTSTCIICTAFFKYP